HGSVNDASVPDHLAVCGANLLHGIFEFNRWHHNLAIMDVHPRAERLDVGHLAAIFTQDCVMNAPPRSILTLSHDLTDYGDALEKEDFSQIPYLFAEQYRRYPLSQESPNALSCAGQITNPSGARIFQIPGAAKMSVEVDIVPANFEGFPIHIRS